MATDSLHSVSLEAVRITQASAIRSPGAAPGPSPSSRPAQNPSPGAGPPVCQKAYRINLVGPAPLGLEGRLGISIYRYTSILYFIT